MNDLKVYQDLFLSSFIFAEYTPLKEWEELSKIASKIDLNLFGNKTPQYFLLRLIKKLMSDYDNTLPASGIILNYIDNLENKNLKDMLYFAFVEAGYVNPLPAKVLDMYLVDFETKYLLKNKGIV